MRFYVKYILVVSFGFFLIGCSSSNKIATETNKSLVFSVKKQKLENGLLERIDSFPSKYITDRNVDIWLPDGYENKKQYAVLYMHDGQRLFTGEADKKGREMMVDETASKLIQENKINDLIVVGIHSIGRLRHSNYFPQKPFEALPEKLTDSLMKMAKAMRMNVQLSSDNYLKFIVEELKPYVDEHYSTKTDAFNTFISGASMGGLISMYAVCEYPEVFGGAACLSTHWPGLMPSKENPIPESFFSYMKVNLPPAETHKFYFDFGTKGMDRFYGEFEEDVNMVFEEKGYTSESFVNSRIEGGNHSEEFWSKRFDIPLLFLLNK